MYRELWNLSIFLLISGALSAACGAVLRYYANRDIPFGGTAEARVIDIVSVPRDGRASFAEFQNSLAAVFEFYADGKPVKVIDDSDRYPCPYHIGERVRICYDPEKPERYTIMHPTAKQKAASRISAVSLALVLAGCAVFLIYAALAGRAE